MARVVGNAVPSFTDKEDHMRAWDNPTDPNRQPPDAPEIPDDPGEPRQPDDRPPFDTDPEAQRAPGAEGDGSGEAPPMQA